MSSERAWVVGLPAEPSVLALVEDVRSAASRAAKSEPGDRFDVARFEALVTRLEVAALSDSGAPRIEVSVPADGPTLLVGTDVDAWPKSLPDDIRRAAISLVTRQLVPVLVVDPFAHGATGAVYVGKADAPADPWAAEEGVYGGRAVEARFRAQIAEALNPDATRRVPISPSGINNAVVAEVLREFVESVPGAPRIDAPVEYRDGSKAANAFPLRALRLSRELPQASLELKFTLLSIRHAEMDAVVDGAWLRNAEISRPRPAAQTDDLVYDISLRQLEELCRIERHVRLHLYQTGLETAVVGFYRALTVHLLKHPGTFSVQPMYFVTPPKQKRQTRPQQGRNGRGAHGGGQHGGDRARVRTPDQLKPVIAESSTFRKGTVWSM